MQTQRSTSVEYLGDKCLYCRTSVKFRSNKPMENQPNSFPMGINRDPNSQSVRVYKTITASNTIIPLLYTFLSVSY